jgi:hypothetical protein
MVGVHGGVQLSADRAARQEPIRQADFRGLLLVFKAFLRYR